jgi:hypothetical protein
MQYRVFQNPPFRERSRDRRVFYCLTNGLKARGCQQGGKTEIVKKGGSLGALEIGHAIFQGGRISVVAEANYGKVDGRVTFGRSDDGNFAFSCSNNKSPLHGKRGLIVSGLEVRF